MKTTTISCPLYRLSASAFHLANLIPFPLYASAPSSDWSDLSDLLPVYAGKGDLYLFRIHRRLNPFGELKLDGMRTAQGQNNLIARDLAL